ncbi:MAG: P1 family peptidase [Chloroflexota bacterium]|nr:P1 family peptidase [Chloroflexota bacterium]
MRIRDLGIDPGWLLTPGARNAIIDVPGVRVGHVTRIDGDSIRTGVTAIVAHGGSLFERKVPAGVASINGFGKATGFEQIRERGVIETPIVLTNTLNIGRASDALIAWMLRDHPRIGIDAGTVCPIVGECNDGFLSDIRGRHIGQDDVWAAIDGAREDETREGNVGAGTGTNCFQFKGGIGTASRRILDGRFTVGALVQTNYGDRAEMRFFGAPIGRHLIEAHMPTPGPGSIMMVLATDAPLDGRQLSRLAMRAAFALGRTGTVGHDGSGDFAIAFSTANPWDHSPSDAVASVERFTESGSINACFTAAVETVEEAIWNALVAAETMTGRAGNTLHAIPHETLLHWWRHYNPA